MTLRIDPKDAVPIFRQIVAQVKQLIAAGRLTSGEELPSVRALAEQLVINPNTVARAYQELEHERVVVKRHGAGTYVAEVTQSPMSSLARRELLTERVDALLTEASHLEVPLEEVIDLVRQRHQSWVVPLRR
jgi:GntR family transcriptional regulator